MVTVVGVAVTAAALTPKVAPTLLAYAVVTSPLETPLLIRAVNRTPETSSSRRRLANAVKCMPPCCEDGAFGVVKESVTIS